MTDMLEHIFPYNGQMYPLIGANSNETCRTRYTAQGYGYFDKNENWEEGWGDENFVYRAFDISSYRNNEVYCLRTKLPDGSMRYGSPWTPRYMVEGQVFKRDAWVIHYDAQGNVTKQALVTTWIKLLKYHASKTFASGRTVQGVAELQYGFNPDVSDVREHYFYGKGLGLVGFEDGVITTAIGQGTPTDIKPQTVIPWINTLRPPVPPSDTVTPPPVPSGGSAQLYVTATAGLKLRRTPNGDVIRTMPYEEQVTGYPANPQTVAGYTWIIVTDALGNTGWAATLYLAAVIAPTPPETWTVKLDVPYVSQLGTSAAASNNDCGPASLLMMIRYWMTRHGLSVPSVPSVDDVVRYTPLAQVPPPKGLTFAQLEQLAAKLGYRTTYTQPATMDWIAQQLRDDKPVMCLVDYLKFNPSANSQIAHLCIVSGYNSTHFLTQDPYLAGDNYRISRAQLNESMRSSPGNTVGWQAMTLAV